MESLRQAAARERRFPIAWWLFLMVLAGGMFVAAIYPDAPHAAWLVALLLAAAWSAPLVAYLSLAAPRRARIPPPLPGRGSYADWRKQARLLGRVLLYHEDNPELSDDMRRMIHAAREDLRDTLKAHPLRDDLERVCGRIRTGALAELKDWLWRRNRHWIRELKKRHQLHSDAEPNGPVAALKAAVEESAATMIRECMPRMLERERLACALECAWVAAQVPGIPGHSCSPVEVAGALVVEWCDFSLPWDPDRMLERSLERLSARPGPDAAPEEAGEADPPAPIPHGTETVVIRNGRRYRRVRVHRHRRRVRRSRHGPSVADILLSFGQWVRYSVRSWMLYR